MKAMATWSSRWWRERLSPATHKTLLENWKSFSELKTVDARQDGGSLEVAIHLKAVEIVGHALEDKLVLVLENKRQETNDTGIKAVIFHSSLGAQVARFA